MSRHLLIAGTGRAGTSFLVRYLTQIGLDTNLSRAGAAAAWDERANAGLEDNPLFPAELPYVIKSPFTYQMIHDVLARGTVQFDAVVIPMRDLTEAASSRSIIETQALHKQLPWMADLEQTWEHFGHTWGGMVVSTNPVDQARLLAVGFHQLLDKLVKADIPVILLSFPRLIEDADYLYRKLTPVLPATLSAGCARSAHAAVADPAKVRVGTEVLDERPETAEGFTLSGPGRARLDRAAMARMLAEARREVEDIRAQLADAITTVQTIQAVREREAAHLLTTQQALNAAAGEKDRQDVLLRMAEQALREVTEEKDRHIAELRAATAQTLAAVTKERDEARAQFSSTSSIAATLQNRIVRMENATTWRVAQTLVRGFAWLPGARPIARRLRRIGWYPASEPRHNGRASESEYQGVSD